MTCSYTTATPPPSPTLPAPPAPETAGRKQPGHAPPPTPSFSLSGGRGGAETGQGSDLISQEGREKGAARWIRVLPWLYFIPSPPLTRAEPAWSTQPEVEFLPRNKSSQAGPNLVAAVFRNDARLL